MKRSKDWTVNPQTGRSNASQKFLDLCKAVEFIIRDDAHTLISGHAENTARLIVANLAHVQGMIPGKIKS